MCSVACLEKALKTHRLDAALRVKLTDQDEQSIVEDLRSALATED